MPTAVNVGKPAGVRGTWTLKYCAVTAAQTFKVGDWVGKDSSGTLIIAAAASNDYDSSTPGLLWGIAQANAADILANPSGDLARCPVLVPGRDAEALFQVYHSTTASATIADTDIDGAAAPLKLPLRNQGGVWVLNKENDGTNDAFQITERYPGHSGTDTLPWVWAKLLSSESLEGD